VYPVIFTLPARAELIDAQDWYENEASGLRQNQGSYVLLNSCAIAAP